ncbi:MAG TPA: CdaR family protein [bacterium]|nr:CdaR family protein [bacterium]
MNRWLFENLRLKILALLIGVALWAYVDSRQVLDHRKMRVQVEFTDIPAGMALDPSIKKTVMIQLVGSKETLQDLDPEDLTVEASLKDMTPGTEEADVRPKVSSLPKGVTASASDVRVKLVAADESRDNGKKKSKKN